MPSPESYTRLPGSPLLQPLQPLPQVDESISRYSYFKGHCVPSAPLSTHTAAHRASEKPLESRWMQATFLRHRFNGQGIQWERKCLGKPWLRVTSPCAFKLIPSSPFTYSHASAKKKKLQTTQGPFDVKATVPVQAPISLSQGWPPL